MNAIHLKHMNYLNADERHLAKKHATITKDTSTGFLRFVKEHYNHQWKKDGELLYSSDMVFFYTESELYDIYVKSLEG